LCIAAKTAFSAEEDGKKVYSADRDMIPQVAPETVRSIFLNYLSNIPAVAVSKCSVQIFSAPLTVERQRRYYPHAVSPDGQYLCVVSCDNNLKNGYMKLFDLVKQEQLVEIKEYSNGDLVLVPYSCIWSPANRLFIWMGYSDISYAEWCEFDVKERKFTNEGKSRIEHLLSYNKKDKLRPDGLGHKAPGNIGLPAWSAGGLEFKNEAEAEKAGVKLFWTDPFRRDLRTRMSVHIDSAMGRVGFYAFIEGLAMKDDRGRLGQRVYVMADGKLVTTLFCPCPFLLDEFLLLLYEGPDLVLYRRLGSREENRPPWKVSLGQRIAQSTSMTVIDQERILLETDDEDNVYYDLVFWPREKQSPKTLEKQENLPSK
jgi:hypothetical protein